LNHNEGLQGEDDKTMPKKGRVLSRGEGEGEDFGGDERLGWPKELGKSELGA